MKIPAAVLAEVDYRGAVVAELRARNRYLPPPLADRALLDNVDALAERLKTRMRLDFEAAPQDRILARKLGRGSRPLPYIALEDRLVYRALVSTLTDRLPVVPGRNDYDGFENSPLEVNDCDYVLKADVAAFYQYIDHEQLIDEVVAQTGDDLAVAAVVELLQGGTGRRFGLPQMNRSSDVLADLYVDPIRRDLLRRGHRTFRYADDFRVACSNYSEALECLEQIERSALELGLVLNEYKTGTPSRDKYADSLLAVRNAERELFDELDLDDITTGAFIVNASSSYVDDDTGDAEAAEEELPDVFIGDAGGRDSRSLPGSAHDEADPPEEPEAPRTPTSEELNVAARVIDIRADRAELATYRWNAAVRSTLLGKSLFALELGGDGRAVDSVIDLLVHEPHLTPQVCNYLIAIGSVFTINAV